MDEYEDRDDDCYRASDSYFLVVFLLDLSIDLGMFIHSHCIVCAIISKQNELLKFVKAFQTFILITQLIVNYISKNTIMR